MTNSGDPGVCKQGKYRVYGSTCRRYKCKYDEEDPSLIKKRGPSLIQTHQIQRTCVNAKLGCPGRNCNKDLTYFLFKNRLCALSELHKIVLKKYPCLETYGINLYPDNLIELQTFFKQEQQGEWLRPWQRTHHTQLHDW